MVIAHMSRRLLSLPPGSEYHDLGQEDLELLGFFFIYKTIIARHTVWSLDLKYRSHNQRIDRIIALIEPRRLEQIVFGRNQRMIRGSGQNTGCQYHGDDIVSILPNNGHTLPISTKSTSSGLSAL